MCFRLEGPSCVVQGQTLPGATTAGEVRLSPHSRRRKGDAEAPHSGEEGKVLGLKPRGLVFHWHPGLSDPRPSEASTPPPRPALRTRPSRNQFWPRAPQGPTRGASERDFPTNRGSRKEESPPSPSRIGKLFLR